MSDNYGRGEGGASTFSMYVRKRREKRKRLNGL
jgi:hypothetical protein